MLLVRGIVFSMFALAAALAPCMDITVNSIESCDQNGNPGPNDQKQDYYWIRADFSIQNCDNTTYTVRFQYADETYEFPVQTNYNGTGFYFWVGMWSGGLDGPLPIKVTFDAYNQTNDPTRDDNVKSGTLTPTPPSTGTFYYSPRRYEAWQTTTVDFTGSGHLDRVVAWAYKPVTMEHQTVLNNVPPVGAQTVLTSPFNLPIYQTDVANPPYGTVGFRQSALVDLRRVVVNANLLKGVTWAAVDTAAQQMLPWISKEPIIQSDDPAIAAYVTQQLGSNYRQTMTPYDAAVVMYKAVARDFTYSTTNPGTSALDALTNKMGDCGGMSMVYIACLRHMGIPARTISGWWSGVAMWHVKSEIYLPPYGWISQDTSECELTCPSGAFPYYFGNDRSMDQFFVVNRAQTHIANGLEFDAAFQPGTVFWWGQWSNYQWTEKCSLTELHRPPPPSITPH